MRILAIDPGSMLGWATDATGRLEWGTEDFRIKNGESSGNRWLRFGGWLNRITLSGPREGPPRHESGTLPPISTVDLIVYEQQLNFSPKMRRSAEVGFGFTSRLEEHCERHGIALQPVNVQTLKAFALPRVKRKKSDPKMDRSKVAMIAAAEKVLTHHGSYWGKSILAAKPEEVVEVEFPVKLSEHEADALWLYWWAKENCR